MRAKVSKWHSLALKATSGRPYDPKLVLQGAKVPYIGNELVKFLGAFIQVPPDQHRVRDHLQSKLLSLLERVDSAPVTRHQKHYYIKQAYAQDSSGTWYLRSPYLLGHRVPGGYYNALPQEMVRPCSSS